jgi:hypothetical protein
MCARARLCRPAEARMYVRTGRTDGDAVGTLRGALTWRGHSGRMSAGRAQRLTGRPCRRGGACLEGAQLGRSAEHCCRTGAGDGSGQCGGAVGGAGAGGDGVVPRGAAQQPYRAARAQGRAQRGRGRPGWPAGARASAPTLTDACTAGSAVALAAHGNDLLVNRRAVPARMQCGIRCLRCAAGAGRQRHPALLPDAGGRRGPARVPGEAAAGLLKVSALPVAATSLFFCTHSDPGHQTACLCPCLGSGMRDEPRCTQYRRFHAAHGGDLT